MRFLIRLLLRLLFRFRAEGEEALRGPGPMLLCPNHVSWLDWLFVAACLGDDWKFVASSTTAETTWIHRALMVNRRTFPVDNTSSFAVREMARFLEGGGKLVLFPEGRISNTTGLMKIYDGTSFLIQHSGARVITCYLRNAVRVKWVRHTGWTQWFPRVSAHFSEPQTAPVFAGLYRSAARQKLTRWLRDRIMRQQFDVEMRDGPKTLPAAIAETARRIPGRVAMEDIRFKEITNRRLMTGAEILGGQWRKRFGPEAGERIGVLLPTVTGTAAAVLGLWAAGKVPTFLNYSTGAGIMTSGAKLAGLRHLITAHALIEKARIDTAPLHGLGIQFHYLEDIAREVGTFAKLRASIGNLLSPGRALRDAPVGPEDTAAIIFTSGSEGTPKGVEMRHLGLLANMRQLFVATDLRDDERFFNALPLFHAFGLVGGIVAPLVRGCYSFLYPTPLHYRIVPTVVYEKNCTIMLGTNTFLNGYARKAHAYDFNTVRLLVSGAERVQTATFDTWARKFGVRIHEGYGATECGPVLCINTKMDPDTSSAGRLLPAVEYKLEPVDGVPEGGRLFVRTPAMMKGYLNEEANAAFKALAGWYDTGDIVRINEDGYVFVLGRLKRFAKISGEMVSLTAVEDALAGAFPQHGPMCPTAVVSVPDAEKGEKLILVTTQPRLDLGEVRTVIRSKGMSNLCAPREIRIVASIPKLGSGKTDHRQIVQMLADSERTAATRKPSA